MYPRWDFRSIIETEPETAWRSMLREPLKELLNYWHQSGRPEHLKSVYCQGLYEGIVRDRWPCFQLNVIEGYPEFYSCVRLGLEQVWDRIRFSLHRGDEGPCLLIDTPMGEVVEFSPEQKRQILNLLRYRFTVGLTIDHSVVIVGIVPSKRARDIYQRIFWLSST